MRYLLLLFITIIVNVTSCREANKTSTNPVTDSAATGEMKIMIPNTYCFSTSVGKDSVYLKLEKFPNVVTGKLIYKLYEKDSNTGDIDGVMRGDTLVADYKFLSEGVTSVRQIIFLIKDDTAREGYGEMEERNGKMIFKTMQQINFSNGHLLKKIACPVQ